MKFQEATRQGLVFGSLDMQNHLVKESKRLQQISSTLEEEILEQVAYAFLSACIGGIRDIVHHYIFYDAHNNEQPRNVSLSRVAHTANGRMCLVFTNRMEPLDETLGNMPREYSTQIERETGMPAIAVAEMLHIVGTKLIELSGEKGFEPLGWIEATYVPDIIIIRLWDDFLQPEWMNQ